MIAANYQGSGNGKPSAHEVPRVGVAVLLFAGRERILLGKRKGYGEGKWAMPGGRLELGEGFADCARRELYEETGIKIPAEHFHFFGVTNDIFEDGAHWITVVYSAGLTATAPARIMEPDKCYQWGWFSLQPSRHDSIPRPQDLYLPFRHLLEIDLLGTGGESANGFSI